MQSTGASKSSLLGSLGASLLGARSLQSLGIIQNSISTFIDSNSTELLLHSPTCQRSC